MAINTGISWANHTWNPWQGCTKVSAGCKFCYMYRDKEFHKQDPTTVVRSSDATFYAPLKKKAFLTPGRVFTCSWSDFWHEAADDFRLDALRVIFKTQHLTYMILTKRIERTLDCLRDAGNKAVAQAYVSNNIDDISFANWLEMWLDGFPPKNVWLGVTVEDQDAANVRLPILRELRDYATILFVSFEPLIGPIRLSAVPELLTPDWMSEDTTLGPLMIPFDWAIIGGESGNEVGKYQYRPCELAWIASLIAELKADNVSTFVKQLGTSLSKRIGLQSRHGSAIEEWPLSFQVQNFPESG